jgi:hypothetical protein
MYASVHTKRRTAFAFFWCALCVLSVGAASGWGSRKRAMPKAGIAKWGQGVQPKPHEVTNRPSDFDEVRGSHKPHASNDTRNAKHNDSFAGMVLHSGGAETIDRPSGRVVQWGHSPYP